ncbi:MAG: CDP-alcohol phosphatidyltransferase family protein [Methylococcaceae bacterium]|nr:CDP-alcohol phosphatidyltransferase family protein [Methylococcaceae bacterium]
MGLSLVAVLAGLPIVFFAAAALVSFSVLILQFRRRWTPSGRFGSANAITLIRLTGVSLLLSLAGQKSGGIGAVALLLLALDGIDGWVARRWNLSSEFGEFFDKEVDAFFLLALCLLLYEDRCVGSWVLIPGLLRYLFVSYLKFAGTRETKEQRSRLGCWSYCLMMLSLISTFFVPEAIYVPLILVMTSVLCASFADTLRWMHRPAGMSQGAE